MSSPKTPVVAIGRLCVRRRARAEQVRKSSSIALSILLATSIAGSAYSQEQSAPPATPSARQAAQSAATPPPRPTRILLGTDMAYPIQVVQPVYPADVKITGTVVLHAIIDYDGSVLMLDTVSGNPILAAAATDAVKQWHYKPMLLNNQPVQFETRINVVFMLDKKGNLKPQPKKTP
jgi:TonB family protein